ncbi:MAG: serine hydroxymethyltransferase [Candidatus Omnitrophica bacterium 4484_70.2]|nr:MAG: serine hydroxymethyltransferase [Candidatus Omnitrophica bacterium 4484_70.2]
MWFEHLKKVDPQIYEAVISELKRQREHLELIASENFTSLAVLETQGSVLTNKYAEGYPKKRWYGGCEFVDVAEELARKRAMELFGAEYANVQPHSGTQANMAVLFSVLEVGDTIMAMDLACGGHLSHGHPLNFTGRLYKVIPYGVNRDTELLDYEEIRKLALKYNPKLIIAGASAYPRIIDFEAFKDICQEVGALLLVDMAHIAGLVATGLHPNPCNLAEFVTTTTHKTLRGPRGGLILCKKEFAKKLDTNVFPGIQGGPLMHVIAAKAVALKEAQSPQFKEYQENIVKNARALAQALKERGYRIVSGSTDNHLLLVDLRDKGLTGKEAQKILEEVNITVNKNLIPFDPQSAFVTSGIRLGTPAITTRGMKESQMYKIAELIDKALSKKEDLESIKREVLELLDEFPLYPEIEIPS